MIDITNAHNDPLGIDQRKDDSGCTDPRLPPPIQHPNNHASTAAASNEEFDGDPLGSINDDQNAPIDQTTTPAEGHQSTEGQEAPQVRPNNGGAPFARNKTSNRKKPSSTNQHGAATTVETQTSEIFIDLDLENENNPHLIFDKDGLICKPPGEPGRATSTNKKGYVLRRAMGYPPELPKDHSGRDNPVWVQRNESYLQLHVSRPPCHELIFELTHPTSQGICT